MTLLIKNVQLLDGTGGSARRLDVFISGDKISALGSFPYKPAAEVIDGQGAWLMPGFIDARSSADHYLSLFRHPAQETFLKQGVTTAVIGHEGVALAPLVYGDLSLWQQWTDTRGINIDWHTVRDFFQALKTQRFGINFATLAGYDSLRHDITGGAARAPTKNEVAVIRESLRRALQEGAAGISLNLEEMNGKEVSAAQLKLMAEIAAEKGKPLAVMLSRNRERHAAEFEALIKLAKQTHVKLLVSGVSLDADGADDGAGSVYDFINQAKAHAISLEINPCAEQVAHWERFLPTWALADGSAAARDKLKDDWLRPRIMQEMSEIDATRCLLVHSATLPPFAGRSLQALHEMYHADGSSVSRDPRETLITVLADAKFRASLSYPHAAPQLLQALLEDETTLIGSHATYTTHRHDGRDVSATAIQRTFTDVFAVLPPEQAAHKLTARVAKMFNLKQRGEIKEGNFADLVIMRDNRVEYTLVGGKVVVRQGVYDGVRAGALLPILS